MRMLSNDDLHAIGAIVDEKIDKKLEPVHEAVREGFGEMEARMATKDDIVALGAELRGEMAEMRHGLMDHTGRTISKAVGDLRSELRERDLIG